METLDIYPESLTGGEQYFNKYIWVHNQGWCLVLLRQMVSFFWESKNAHTGFILAHMIGTI